MFQRLLNLLLHLIAIAAVVISVLPIADWYLHLAQIPGSDYWNTATYLQKLSQDLTFPATKWYYHWFTGTPAAIDYPWLHLYLMQPLVKVFGVIQAQSYYALGSLIVFGIFTYLWLGKLVNNSVSLRHRQIATAFDIDKGKGKSLAMTDNAARKIFATALTIGLLYSLSLYPSLIIIGSTTFFATQGFLPMTLYFIERWQGGFKSQESHPELVSGSNDWIPDQVRNDEGANDDASSMWFYLAVLTTGLTMYGHPAIGLVFTIPLCILIITFGSHIQQRLAWGFKFIALTLLLSSAILSHYFLTLFQSFFRGSEDKFLKLNTVKFAELFPGGVAIFNYLIIGALAGGVLLWLSSKLVVRLKDRPSDTHRKFTFNPYLLGIIYIVVFFGSLIAGHNPLSGLLHGPRLAWVGTLVIAGLTAAIFSQLHRYLIWITTAVIVLAFILYRPWLFQLVKDNQGPGYISPSSMAQNFDLDDTKALKGDYAPEWLDADQTNYRLYALDDKRNMWWNGVYDLPQVRGYYPGASPSQKEAFLGQLDNSVMDDEEVKTRGFTVEEAAQVAHFYLDWYAVKYLALTGRFQLSSYLNNDTYIHQQTRAQGVNYLEINSDLISPILSATNAPTLCFLGSDRAYNYLLRTMAKWDWNSSQLVIIKGPGKVHQVDRQWLSACDSLVIYDLKAGINLNPLNNQQGWPVIAQHVRDGTSVFIDTGQAGSVGSQSQMLPEVFPISTTQSHAVSDEWQWQVSDSPLLIDVRVADFSPPKWEDYGWKLSLTDPEQVRDWAAPVLSHDQQVVLAAGQLDQGLVIWSGLNLPFHADYYSNRDEMQLLRNIIKQLLTEKLKNQETEKHKNIETGKSSDSGQAGMTNGINWLSPQKRQIEVNQARGVLFKANGWLGWHAVTDTGENLSIYHAGPNYPGFMYVPLPDDFSGQVIFTFRGSFFTWLSFIISGLTLIFILEHVLLQGKLSGVLFGPLTQSLARKFNLKKWWDKEDYE